MVEGGLTGFSVLKEINSNSHVLYGVIKDWGIAT